MKKLSWFYSILFMCFFISLNFGYGQSVGKVHTTLDRTIVPDIVSVIPAVSIYDAGNFEKFGYGKWHYGPGLPFQKRLDLMPAGYNFSSVSKAVSLLRFFTMTDVHITDKESPAQAIFFAGWNLTAVSIYSPLMLYTTHVLNAAVKTINELHKVKPFDLGLALGDLANSTQYNELRWFIDVMDGKNIKPNSGAQKEPLQDFQKEYEAAGLDKSIPWYAAVGNHDHFWLGSKQVNDKVRKVLVGDKILKLGNIFTDANAMNEDTYSVGTIDCSFPYGKIIGSGVTAELNDIPTISPDANRRSLSKSEWIGEFSNTTSIPKGHGFIQSNPNNAFNGCYSFEPKSELPLKIIVIDNTMDEADKPVKEGIFGHGSLNNGRYEWLMSQLKAGQEEGKLMIIAAHIPIGVEENSPMDWNISSGYSSQRDLIKQLQSFPNLLLWVSGHRHLNTVTAFPSKDASHPENAFWEVETKSLREFPQQFRTFDVVLNNDNTISIFTVNVDPKVEEGTAPWISRSYALASNQIYGLYEAPQPTGNVSYNAELVKMLSPEMAEKLSGLKK